MNGPSFAPGRVLLGSGLFAAECLDAFSLELAIDILTASYVDTAILLVDDVQGSLVESRH